MKEILEEYILRQIGASERARNNRLQADHILYNISRTNSFTDAKLRAHNRKENSNGKQENNDPVFLKLCSAETTPYLRSGENIIYSRIILNNILANKWLIRERLMSEKHYSQLNEMSINDIIDSLRNEASELITQSAYLHDVE